MREIGSCKAVIYKVSTMMDGSCRITLDIGADNANLAAELLKLKLTGNDYIAIGIALDDNGQTH